MNGLAFAGATLFFEQAREAFDLKLALRVAGAKFRDFSFQADAVEAWDISHIFTLAAA